ncbi:MAG: bifunctional phosphoglucose/phosphomannose isomerase, partial [Actinobacteria bacterium]|nr:bifunctional phosphoglucose/phosphomannose isomerase [Actinomycetota bacterium]
DNKRNKRRAMSERLDNINSKRADTKNMLLDIEKFPQTCLDAWNLMRNFAPPSYYIKPKKFVILGMGASGISGEIIKDLLNELGNSDVVEVVHDYKIPGWVDKDTLVIANSYSGNTEETLAAFLAAKEKGAKLLVITTGGKLKVLADKFNVPCLLFNYKSQPRAAFPYLFVSLLSIFAKIGRLNISDSLFNKSLETLNEYAEKYKVSNRAATNPAKILASKLYDSVPIIYASGALTAIGKRLKCQINENSKNFSFYEIFPELNHNALEGYHHPKLNSFVVILESNYDHQRVAIRQNITCEILRRNKIKFERVKFLPCDSYLSEVLVATLFSDYVSFYLAVLNDEDPSTIRNIEYLKQELAK